MKPKYSWKRNTMGIKAEVAARELRILQDKYGALTPECVVAEAKKKTSVLHNCFEWDDVKAAKQHRLAQARYMLRSITIEVQEIEVRAFTSVIVEEENCYVSMQTAKRDPALKRQVIAKALKEVKDWQERYSHIKEFMGIRKAIDDYDSESE